MSPATFRAGVLVVIAACVPASCVNLLPFGILSDVLVLQTGTLPAGDAGVAYRAQIKASGGVKPFSFARTRGDEWPEGVALDPATGQVSGVPAAGTGGAYFVDVAVTDSADPPATHERRLTLIVFEKGNEFGAIRSWILPTCAAAACHSSPSHIGELILEPANAYANLVGVTPDNAVAAAGGGKLVDPGHPDNSFMLRKMTGDLGAEEGSVMPQAGVRLPDDQVALVRQWIEQGALPAPGEDTTAVDTGGTSGPVEATLELGETVEQIYSPLRDGDILQVWFGFQGGVWVLPTIRATGLDTSVSLEATLTTAEGVRIGETAFDTNMTPTLEGTEFQNVLVPILTAVDVDSILDTDVVLFFRLIDDEGSEATIELNLVLKPA